MIHSCIFSPVYFYKSCYCQIELNFNSNNNNNNKFNKRKIYRNFKYMKYNKRRKKNHICGVIVLVHTSSVVDYTIPSRSKGKDGLAQHQVNVPG